MRRSSATLGLCLAVVGAQSCGMDFVEPLRFEVDPPRLLLTLGESQQLQVSVRDAEGTLVPDRTIAFSSADEGVAVVTSNGVVFGTGFGFTQVDFVSGDLAGFVQTRVSPLALSIIPRSTVVGVGRTDSVTVSVFHPDGHVMDVPLTWTSRAPSIVQVDQVGGLLGMGIGRTYVVVAVEGGEPDSISVRVGPKAEGSWDGWLLGGGFVMTLFESEAGSITGSVDLGGLHPTISGTVDGLSVKMVWSAPQYEPAEVRGEFVGEDEIRGTIDGSGFTNDSISFRRQ